MADYSLHIAQIRASILGGATDEEERAIADLALTELEKHLGDIDRRLRTLEG